MENSLYVKYFEIQKSLSNKEISFEKYSDEIIKWNNEYTDIIKSQVDGSRGGKLVKKKVIDKKGHEVTKWVKRDQSGGKESKSKESDTPLDVWKNNAPKADVKSLQRASVYSKNENIRRIAKNELFKRKFNLNTFLSMSAMPDFLLNDYIERYKYSLTSEETTSINEYKDSKHASINNRLRGDNELDEGERRIIRDLDNTINNSPLLNDVILYRGLSGKNSLLFINYLKSLDVGDEFEEKGYSSTSIIQVSSEKFKNLYKSTNNIALKIYASKGQNAMCMQNFSNEKTKDEYEFLLPRNSKFQIIENLGEELKVKLI